MVSRRIAYLATILAWSTSAPAQTPVDPLPDQATLAARAAKRFPQPVRVGLLIGRRLLEPKESQPVLGHVEGIYRQPGGTLDILVRYGGIAGLGARSITIPLDGIALLGEYVVAIDYNRAQLDTFPTATAPGTPLDPNETIRMGIVKPFH